MTWSDYSSAKNWIEHARGYVDEINIFADALGKHRLPYPKWIDWNMTQLVGWRNGKYLKELLRIKRLLEIEQKKAQKLGDKYEGFYINVPKEYPEDYWDGSIYLHDLDDFKEHLGKTNKEIENSKVKLLQITGYDKQLKAMQGNMSKVKSILNKPKEPEIDLSHVAELLNRT